MSTPAIPPLPPSYGGKRIFLNLSRGTHRRMLADAFRLPRWRASQPLLRCEWFVRHTPPDKIPRADEFYRDLPKSLFRLVPEDFLRAAFGIKTRKKKPQPSTP